MKENAKLKSLSKLALQRRRQGLAQSLPRMEETLRGSLFERHTKCGNPRCRCAQGEQHGPFWYLTTTLGPGRTVGSVVSAEQLSQVQEWIDNYQKFKEHLEKISEINRELLRRQRRKSRK